MPTPSLQQIFNLPIPPHMAHLGRVDIPVSEPTPTPVDAHVLQSRPQRLAEFAGQLRLKSRLSIAIQSALLRGETLPHVLLYGPPGLGKTTLATIIANELGAKLVSTMATGFSKGDAVSALALDITQNSVVFMDEIHRLPTAVEERFYTILEDFKLDDGGYDPLQIPKFTMVGATTLQGAVSRPLRDRFGLILEIEPYTNAELTEVVLGAARRLTLDISTEAAEAVAIRCRGTPRIANHILRSTRDYAVVHTNTNTPDLTLDLVHSACDLAGINGEGLTLVDLRYLEVLRRARGRPMGLTTIAAVLNEDQSTILDVIEPWLMRMGLVERTARGRKLVR